jgi:hypothetical protein
VDVEFTWKNFVVEGDSPLIEEIKMLLSQGGRIAALEAEVDAWKDLDISWREQFLGFRRERDAALARSEKAEAGLAHVKELVDFWFSPWGAAKGARWEELSGDRPFRCEEMLKVIQRALLKPQEPTP